MTGVTTSPCLDPDGADLEAYRRELTGYCYRMLGSGSRPTTPCRRRWSGRGGRRPVRGPLERAHLALPDRHQRVPRHAGRSPQRRARPMDLGPGAHARAVHLADVLPDDAWITPIPDAA